MRRGKRQFLKSYDVVFLVMVIGFVLFGLIILASASGPQAFERFNDSYYFVKHQLVQGVLPGLFAFAVGALVPVTVWKKYAVPLLVATILLLLLVFIPGIGTDYGTFAKSWIQLGPIAFQPSEFAKLTFLFYLAAWLEGKKDTLKDFKEGLVPFLILLSLVGGLIFLQPDLGTLSILLAMALIVFFVAGGSLWHLLGLGASGVGMLALAIKLSPYRAARLTTFMHPELDPEGIGYQVNQALLAVGSGGFLGRGYGHSLQKYQYLPEVIGDSIFAVIGEELGFFFTAAFILILLAFLLRGVKIGTHAKTDFGKYFSIGLMAWIGIQAFVNIGAMLAILPITGVPLPFISYGGTSLIAILAGCGIVLNISKTSKA
jgi:cell division protein FtsW